MYPLDDTIAAVCSPPGGAAHGIVRLSGPRVEAILRTCFRVDDGRDLESVREPSAMAGTLRLGELFCPLPCELYLWPGGRSYTGQPVAELHTLGSPPLLEAALQTLFAAGARLAEPGEFTLRAFLAGRLDLTEAEAVLGVVEAADQNELDVALRQLAGGLAEPLGQLRSQLLDLLAHLEAGFDFADEDLPFITPERLHVGLAEAVSVVERLARQMTSRGEAGELTRVVLTGRPNTGKSSLFNALAERTGALVSHRPGTTRDYLTAELDFDGVGCQLIDTAGVDAPLPCPADDEEAGPSIEQAARQAAAQQRRRAQVQVLCLDCTRPLDVWEAEQLDQLGSRQIAVLTKTDLPAAIGPLDGVLPTSSVTGRGIDALRASLREAVLTAAAVAGEAVATTAVRCGESLRLAADSLGRARQLAAGMAEELLAAEIRVALDELGKVVGAVYTDDVLDRIFSRFCIGK